MARQKKLSGNPVTADPLKAKLRKVERTSVGEEAAKQLMELISSGDLKPGQRLPSERELCKTFGVGRSSLREALRCLSMVGILDARVGEGTSVALNGIRFIEKSLEWSMITEQREFNALVQVRVALEGAAAAEAALNAESEQLNRLEQLLAMMEESLGDCVAFAQLDVEFHVALAQASQNNLLFSLLAMIRSHLVRGMERVLPLPHALPLSYEEHLAIYRAVKKKNPDLARRKMQSHLEASLKRYKTWAPGARESLLHR